MCINHRFISGKIDKHIQGKILQSFCMMSVLTGTLFFSVLGIDITDQGYLLGNSQGWKEPYFMPIWGSVAVLNVLSALFYENSYLIQKLLAQLWYLILALIFYHSTSRRNKNSSCLLVFLVLLVPWISRSPLSEWLYYSTWSGILISIAILCLNHYVHSKKKLFLNIGVSLIFASIAFKITNLIFLGLLPLTFLLDSDLARTKIIVYRKIFSIWATALILVCVLAFHFGILSYIEQGFTILREFTALTVVHTPKSLIEKSFLDLKHFSVPGLSFALFTGCLLLSEKSRNNKTRWALRIVLSLSFIFLHYKFRLYMDNGLFIFYILALTIFFCRKKNAQRFLPAATIYFLSTCSIGSSAGLRGAFIAEPLACFVILSYLWDEENSDLKSMLATIVFSLTVIGVSVKAQAPYREVSRIQLNSRTYVPALRGSFTTIERANALNEIWDLRRRLFPNSKTALIYPSAPLFHHILDLKPFLPNPWINLNFPSQLKILLRKQIGLPDVVIKLKQNPRKASWPNDKTPIVKDANYPSIEVLDKFVVQQKYKLAAETSHYLIFLKSI